MNAAWRERNWLALHLRPGGHPFHVWRSALSESLTWALSSSGGDRR